ncbi:MAG TPA: AtpZ/AtpI family protein [Acidimicrobiales bacterium]|jgi:F0F1-type ATP synthase assembly protein I
MGQRPGRDLTLKQELNRGFGDALATAFELALTPAIMGLIGWWLDRWLGTGPFLFLFLFVFTVSYEIWKLFKRYEMRMHAEQSKVKGLRPPQEPGA